MSPLPGLHVFTRDGHELGTVKEIGEDSFKVDAPRKRDYWLSIGSILSIDRKGVEMDFDYERLESFQLEGPDEGVVSESPVLDAAADTFSSPQEKQLRREQNIHGGEINDTGTGPGDGGA